MSCVNRFISQFGPGWYSIESLSVIEINALPSYLHDSLPILNMLDTYSYDLKSVARNNCRMLALGFLWRFATLASLLFDANCFVVKWRRFIHDLRGIKNNDVVRACVNHYHESGFELSS